MAKTTIANAALMGKLANASYDIDLSMLPLIPNVDAKAETELKLVSGKRKPLISIPKAV
jgi:hypothetical protein